MRKTRITGLIIVALMAVLPASAVLKEKNLENTLSILRAELTDYYKELEEQSEALQQQQEQMGRRLMEIYNRSKQNSLMIYSQNQGYTFNLSYACHEATEMYKQFQRQALPFRQYIEKTEGDIARYDSLVNNLNQMPTMMMSDMAKTDCNVCLTLAIKIHSTLTENSKSMEEYVAYYNRTEEHLRTLNDYAMRCYDDIQSNIFVNGGDNYFEILRSLGESYRNARSSAADRYKSHNAKVRSQWDVRLVYVLFALIIIYGFVAAFLNVLCIRYLMPKRFRTEKFLSKRTYIIMATSVVTFAIIIGILRLVFSNQYFLIMASQLLVEFAWLLSVIIISLLLRLDGKQIRSALRVYMPLIVVGFIVIVFRIILITNDMVNLIFPPILLVCTIWQWLVIRKHSKHIPRSDTYYGYISLAIFVAAAISSWWGYTLLCVEVLIWWIMQLTCILTITCIIDYMKDWAKRTNFDERPITVTWFYNLCEKVVLPVLGVASIMIAVYWAADVFNLTEATGRYLHTNFINTSSFSASIFSICQVVALYFVFAYINRTVKDFLALRFEKSDLSTAESRKVLWKNVIQVFVWALWILIAMGMFHVGNSWLIAISAGLSTGIGFASKDILENIYYGISLMTGRVKIGDLIECDGYRGKVASISYTSTMIEVVDGSVIAFQNSQLFTKNYKNLTKSHGYELYTLEVGVAYGTDIEEVRAMLTKEIKELDFMKESDRDVSIRVKEFADSSVNLKILAWVPVLEASACTGRILECVYNTLNKNNIEIPFPQMDIHNK